VSRARGGDGRAGDVVITMGCGDGGTLHHLGIEAASADAVREEVATTCCYAGQDTRV
jgi:hypothetical protein